MGVRLSGVANKSKGATILSITGESKGQLEAGWRDLLAKYDLVDAASALAWTALLDAYKSNAQGHVKPTEKLLATYQKARALRIAAEQALVAYMQERLVAGQDSAV